jgi:hypothetical protein
LRNAEAFAIVHSIAAQRCNRMERAVNLIKINGREVKVDAEGRVSLTDLYQSAVDARMAEGKRDPRRWKDEAGSEFIAAVAGALNVRSTDIMKSTRGKGGGTYAHWQIALAYAKYLSPELHMQVNEIYARAKSGDVTLADEIADKATPEQQEWLAKRVQGKVARARFTATLADHNVTGRGFGDCTNAIYKGVLGGSKREVCLANGIEYKKGRSLRDAMNVEDLIATSMAELVAAKQINKFNVRGNALCADECLRSARKVASLMD